jgi:uncharacterized protein YjbI with pentapeptide repeats
LAIILSAIAVTVAIIFIPPYVVGSPKGLAPTDQLNAVNALRGILVQCAGGIILLLGFYFTWRTVTLNRERQITERFSTAVGQLGATAISVRIGAIYALERIARDSPKDRGAIVATLSSFVADGRSHHVAHDGPTGPDIQAALRVLGRRPGAGKEEFRLDLSHANLKGAHFDGGNWDHASFVYSDLDDTLFARSTLNEAHFEATSLLGCGFADVKAQGVQFQARRLKAFFCGADLRGADFSGTDLSGTDFSGRRDPHGTLYTPPAILDGADFTDAKLVGVDFSGVDLRAVTGLTQDQLDTATTNSETKPPDSISHMVRQATDRQSTP